MSTIYSDAAGNKYLGDCRWANHDINYPSTSFLKSIDSLTLHSTFLSDCSSLFSAMSYDNVSVAGSWPTTANTNIFSFTPAGESSGNYFSLKTGSNATFQDDRIYATASLSKPWLGFNEASLYNKLFDYVVCAGSQSIAFKPFLYEFGYANGGIGSNNIQIFFYAGKLLDVNTNYSYYNASFLNQCVMMYTLSTSNVLSAISTSGRHFIVGAQKDLLQTGRAVYTISCSDGQTPGSQWATDMWVYDNNVTLGYPVIGRVPNMLLGVGTYTYLKPVKIQGSVFPDNGSPWYLPVGTFSGKVLLMRCYSSVS